MAEQILYEKEGNIAHIVLNRPEQLNVLTHEMMDEVVKAVHMAEEDDDVKVIILKGNGRCFSAGWDLEDIARMYKIESPPHGQPHTHPGMRGVIAYDRVRMEVYRQIQYCNKNIIAQVHGYCLGAGWFLVQICDLVVASEDAVFGHPEQRMGAAGTMWTLPMEILCCGPKKAREFLLTGRQFSAEEAERLGLINKVVPRDQLERDVKDLAAAICQLPRDGLAIGKAWWHAISDMMGLQSAFVQFWAIHPMVAGIKWSPDEHSFVRDRRDKGKKTAFRERDERFPAEYR